MFPRMKRIVMDGLHDGPPFLWRILPTGCRVYFDGVGTGVVIARPPKNGVIIGVRVVVIPNEEKPSPFLYINR
jgi:hypothetical protein